MKLPHVKKPCKDCPFRQDSPKGWLGRDRMDEILKEDSFVCHKNTDLQCAGHMIISSENSFVIIAQRLGFKLNLSGSDMVFDSKHDCINHHT